MPSMTSMQKAAVLGYVLQLLSTSTGSSALAQGFNFDLTFSADAAVSIDVEATGVPGAQAGVDNAAAAEVSADFAVTGKGSAGDIAIPDLERQDLIPVGTYVRTCDCKAAKTVAVDDIRGISNEFCANGNAKSSAGLSNMVWGFGQFLDHDLALSIENEDAPGIEVETQTDHMELHRVITTTRRGCKNSLNAHTAHIDAGPVYGSSEPYTQRTLRQPDTCYLRTAEGGFLPLTTTTDDKGRFFFIAGDVRVSEHAFLAAQHIVWVREHNRICDEVNADASYDSMSEDAKFDLVREVVKAKFQQVVLEEFLPALGITQGDLEAAKPMVKGPDVSMEFSIAYRLGHDLIGNTVGGIDIARSFDAEKFFLDMTGPYGAPAVRYKATAESNLNRIMTKLSTSSANEIDGKLSDALRNFLFGHSEGHDLAGRNIFRGRELGVPTYAGMAQCFGTVPDATVEAETPDVWVGLLREPKAPGSPLPPTLRAIIVDQFHRSFFGPGGFYWKRNLRNVGKFAGEIASSTYAKIISANTGAAVSGNVFKA